MDMSSSVKPSNDTGRQRLRPWLEAKVDRGNIAGLKWLDRDNKIFSVSWKRGGKQDWSPQDSQIFEEWAKYTGRYREGIDEPDYPTWKTRLRCALNKAQDIQELRDRSDLTCAQPVRVYQFKDQVKAQQAAAAVSHFPYDSASPLSDVSSNSPADPQQTNPDVPTVVDDMNASSLKSGSLGSDLKAISSSDLVFSTVAACGGQGDFGDAQALAPGASPCYALQEADTNARMHAEEPMDFTEHQMNQDMTSESEAVAHGYQIPETYTSADMCLKIRYLKIPVKETVTSNVSGCRLFYDTNFAHYFTENPDMHNELFGPTDLEDICFPFSSNFFETKKQEELTQRLLECTYRGIQLTSNEEGVFCVRKCRCVIYYSSPLTGEEPLKIPRDKPVQLFDMIQFMSSVRSYLNREIQKPKISIQLGFGQKWAHGQDTHDVLISVCVVPSLAHHLLQSAEALRRSCPRSSIEQLDISNETSLDQLAKVLKEMTIQSHH